MVFRGKRKQKERKSKAQITKATHKDQAELIDQNAELLAQKLRLVSKQNASKIKGHYGEPNIKKRQRVAFSKYQMKKVQRTKKASFLWCFDQQGGPKGKVHTHVWQALV